MKHTSEVFETILGGWLTLLLFFPFTGTAAAESWLQLSPEADPTYGSPPPTVAHTAVYNPATNRMIVFGGAHDVNAYNMTNDVWVLTNADGLGGTPAWTKLTLVGGPGPRENHAAAYDQANNRMIVHGGFTAPGYCEGVVNDTWILTNADGSGEAAEWIQLNTAGPAPPRRLHNAAYDPVANRLIIQSGASAGCGAGSDDVWVLTNANGMGQDLAVWTRLTPTGAAGNILSSPAGYDRAGNILITYARFNDHNGIRVLTNANGLGGDPAWADPLPNGLLPPASMYSSGIHEETRNRMAIFGGGTMTGETNDVWRLDHANGQGGTPQWTLLQPVGPFPSPRTFNSTAYNPGTDRMIVFGGKNDTASAIFGDVWVLVDALGAAPDTTPPESKITNPLNGAFVRGTTLVVTGTSSDDSSGVAKVEVTTDNGTNWHVASGTANWSYIWTLSSDGTYTIKSRAVDVAGNTEKTPQAITISVDNTPPNITISGVSDGATYILGAVPVAGFSVADNLSGVASQEAVLTGGSANGVGTFVYTVSASDRAGNIKTVAATYHVAYGFGGFLPPVSLDKSFKSGSTIPIKFQLMDAYGRYISNATATLTLQKLSGNTPAGVPVADASAGSVDARNLFRYSSTDNQYIFNLSTKGLAGGMWHMSLALDDGTIRTKVISFK